MRSNYHAATIGELAIDDLSKLELSDLAEMQAEIVAGGKLWRERSTKFVDALELRFAARAQAMLLAEKQDTGTIHFPESGFDVMRVTGKDIKYDQGAMISIYNRIVAAKENPAVYIKITYEVISETAYMDWPAPVKAEFDAARTVKPSRAKYTFKRVKS